MARTLRQFTCHDDLWARVEALASRRGISTDDVVQAALVQLFSKKTRQPDAPASARPTPGPRPASPPSRATPARPSANLPRPAAAAPAGAGRLPPPAGHGAALARPRTLYLYFEGQCYAVDQDQFVIGRGSKYSDLPIKDANISRRHCAIVRRNGEYFIKDLESTNGVEFNGERVDNHRIEEGTVYRLCDHELRFSFIPPA
jgi:pSer/pThr/pTyr-binding forkhead associated (FHA) protein